MRTVHCLSVGFLMASLALGALPVEALLIDDFARAQSLDLPSDSTSVAGSVAGSMLGGTRHLALHDTSSASSAAGCCSWTRHLGSKMVTSALPPAAPPWVRMVCTVGKLGASCCGS